MNAREIIDSLEKKPKLPKFRTGDTVRVHVKIREGEKERIQVFEGVVIKRRRGGNGASFTVRKISYGIGVERMFADRSPSIERVELTQRGKVRRARLYYLRSRRGKQSTVEGTMAFEKEEGIAEPTAAVESVENKTSAGVATQPTAV
ncbi:MAG: 50S ribosomal protein L19 [Pseudomonadota bacterium]